MRIRDPARLARFKSFDVDPSISHGLAADHPAVVKGHSLFPSTVKGVFESPRFLVSGQNNPKIGGRIEKGAWAGMPMYMLTLEERATCPRSCEQWSTCYSNSMPFARRSDASDPDFIPALKAEVITLVRQVCSPIDSKPGWVPPRGIVIRLHVLGDFFSVAYVRMWAQLLDFLPEVNCYGYTARRRDDPDGDSAAIAAEIHALTSTRWDRFAIRTSSSNPGAARSRSIVVEAPPTDAGTILCPAQVHKSEACSTCTLCFAEGARDKTIAFLRHGMKRPTRRGRHVEPDARGLMPAQARFYATLQHLAGVDGVVSLPAKAICAAASVSIGTWGKLVRPLVAQRRLRLLRPGVACRPAVYQVFAAPQGEFGPAPVVPLPARKAKVRAPKPRRIAAPKPLPAPAPRRQVMEIKARYHPRTGNLLNPWAIGTADRFEIGTAEQRLAALDEDEKRRIAAAYGAQFK